MLSSKEIYTANKNFVDNIIDMKDENDFFNFKDVNYNV